MKEESNGLALVIGAYLFWGAYPVYLKALKSVGSFEIMAHRIVWASAAMLVYSLLLGRGRALMRAAGCRRTLMLCAISALLLSSNWVVYATAVNTGHLGDASLGNFVNPLLSIALGAVCFGERLTALQRVACVLASIGVAMHAWFSGSLPWIGLFLASTFAVYGALRKVAKVGAFDGLAVETAMLVPFALIYLEWLHVSNTMRFAHAPLLVDIMLVGIGPISAVPLMLFAAGTARIRLTTLGLVQFISPCVQFALAFGWYGESLSGGQLAAFGVIWCALLLYGGQVFWAGRAAREETAVR